MDDETKHNVEKMHEIAAELDEAELNALIEEAGDVEPDTERALFVSTTFDYVTPPMEKGLSLEIIDKAYDFLFQGAKKAWETEYGQAERKDWLFKMKAQLAIETAKALADGRNDGGNEDKRKAKSRELFPDMYKSIEDLEREIALAEVDDISVCNLRVKLAQSNIDRINMKLRFLELSQLAGAMEVAQKEVPIEKPKIIQTAQKYKH